MPKRRPPLDRFWEKVQKDDGCWEWQGSRVSQGYGKFYEERRHLVGAHRYSWSLINGPIPPGMYVLHHCDNPPCVRPDHLWLGTLTDNQQDMYAKGRARDRWGRPKRLRPSVPHRLNRARLTPDEVAAIRNRPRRQGSLKAIADELGVGYTSAWMCSVGRTYRDKDEAV